MVSLDTSRSRPMGVGACVWLAPPLSEGAAVNLDASAPFGHHSADSHSPTGNHSCGFGRRRVRGDSAPRASARRAFRTGGVASDVKGSYLVDPASSHMLVSKIKPCMSKYKLLYTVKLRMAH